VTFTHSLACLVIALSVVGAIRWSWTQSQPIGVLVLVGVMLRAILGLGLYWISLRHLPIMRSLQLGDGFWTLALDGRTYYDSARLASEHGLATISPTSPSPVYVELLALALRVCGESPLTAVLLNVVAYTAACVICISMWPPLPNDHMRRARTLAVGALSLSPSFVLASTQPLKDQLFGLFVVAAIACVRTGLTLARRSAPHAVWRSALTVAGAAAAVYAIGGLRAYYAMFVSLATAAVLTAITIFLPLGRWMAHLTGTATITAVLWIAFVAGAGPYSQPYQDVVLHALHIPSAWAVNLPSPSRWAVNLPTASAVTLAPANRIELAREGFVNSGGATNIVRTRRPSGSTIDKLLDEAWGLMVIAVPISLMRALSLISVSGGRGLLIVTDLDTIFIDVTLALQLWIVFRRWSWRERDVPFLSFALSLGTVVLLLMAYVVTNYGTLFRLRLMYAIPLWLAGAAVAAGAVQADPREPKRI
jgi:hypothetical protein